MSSTNKKLIALLSAMIVVVLVVIIMTVQLFSKGSSESEVHYVPGTVQENPGVIADTTTTANASALPQGTPAVNQTTQNPTPFSMRFLKKTPIRVSRARRPARQASSASWGKLQQTPSLISRR